MRNGLQLPDLVAACTLLLISAGSLGAEMYSVTKQSDDDGPCTVDDCALREAIIAANANPGIDSILVPEGTYVLSIPGIEEDSSLTGDLDVTDDIEIEGETPGLVTIVGDGTDRIMTIASSTARLSNLVITGGNVPAPGGGLALISSEVWIRDTSIVENHVSGNTDGGGLFVGISRLTLENCTVSRNSAARSGGGILRLGLGPGTAEAHLALINTTVSANSAPTGAGIDSLNEGSMTIVNSTIVNNNPTNETGSSVRAVERQDYSWTNSIHVGRCGFVNAFAPDSNGGNLESPGNTCVFSHPTDQADVSAPGLGPLRDNGGPTQTHALLTGSPAIDAALGGNCPSTDQRGLARPFDGDDDGVAICDAGAVEFVNAYDVPIPTLGQAGHITMALLLAAIGVRHYRRRRG